MSRLEQWRDKVAKAQRQEIPDTIGLQGRKTGIRLPSVRIKDPDGLDNIESFFASEDGEFNMDMSGVMDASMNMSAEYYTSDDFGGEYSSTPGTPAGRRDTPRSSLSGRKRAQFPSLLRKGTRATPLSSNRRRKSILVSSGKKRNRRDSSVHWQDEVVRASVDSDDSEELDVRESTATRRQRSKEKRNKKIGSSSFGSEEASAAEAKSVLYEGPSRLSVGVGIGGASFLAEAGNSSATDLFVQSLEDEGTSFRDPLEYSSSSEQPDDSAIKERTKRGRARKNSLASSFVPSDSAEEDTMEMYQYAYSSDEIGASEEEEEEEQEQEQNYSGNRRRRPSGPMGKKKKKKTPRQRRKAAPRAPLKTLNSEDDLETSEEDFMYVNPPRSSAKKRRKTKGNKRRSRPGREGAPSSRRRREQPVHLLPEELSPKARATPGRRRSKRKRIRPLQYWKNEKVVYGRPGRDSCDLPGIKQVLRAVDE